MVARLGVVDICSDAGSDIIASLKPNALLMQTVHQPLQCIQRMPEDRAAGAALDYLSVQAKFDWLCGEIQMTPVRNQCAPDPCTMAGVVGDKRGGADRGPTMKTAVDDFYPRQDT